MRRAIAAVFLCLSLSTFDVALATEFDQKQTASLKTKLPVRRPNMLKGQTPLDLLAEGLMDQWESMMTKWNMRYDLLARSKLKANEYELMNPRETFTPGPFMTAQQWIPAMSNNLYTAGECTVFNNWNMKSTQDDAWRGKRLILNIVTDAGETVPYASQNWAWDDCLAACKRMFNCGQVVYSKSKGECMPMIVASDEDQDGKGGMNLDWMSAHCPSETREGQPFTRDYKDDVKFPFDLVEIQKDSPYDFKEAYSRDDFKEAVHLNKVSNYIRHRVHKESTVPRKVYVGSRLLLSDRKGERKDNDPELMSDLDALDIYQPHHDKTEHIGQAGVDMRKEVPEQEALPFIEQAIMGKHRWKREPFGEHEWDVKLKPSEARSNNHIRDLNRPQSSWYSDPDKASYNEKFMK